jgi:hypothetical protein
MSLHAFRAENDLAERRGDREDEMARSSETTERQGQPRVGDVVEITGHRVGDAPRLGEILEVIGRPEYHLRVRWEDGHESIFYPGSDVVIKPARSAASGARRASA